MMIGIAWIQLRHDKGWIAVKWLHSKQKEPVKDSRSRENWKKALLFPFTYFGSVENNVFAIWKDADRPRWQAVLDVIEFYPRSLLRVVVWQKSCTASRIRRKYMCLKNVIFHQQGFAWKIYFSHNLRRVNITNLLIASQGCDSRISSEQSFFT